MDRRVIASGGADPPGEGRRAWPGPRSRSSTPRPPRPARPLRAADLGRQAASMRLPDARVLTCTIPRYVGRSCAVVRQGARRAVMLGASQAPGNAAGGRARPPCGSRFPPPRGVGNALRCHGIAVTPPTAEETGNAIIRAVESCKGVLASRYTPFLACRPISAVPHLSMGRVEEGARWFVPHWHHSVSLPRSSNRTCEFPASGFPTGFIPRHTAGGQDEPGAAEARRDPRTRSQQRTAWCRATAPCDA